MTILWIGGPPASGKTTIARRLAIDYDLGVYHADRRLLAHQLRDPLPPLDPGHTAAQLKDRFLANSSRRLPLVLEDLASMRLPRPIVVESPLLRPADVSDHGVWLVPSDAFLRDQHAERRTHPLLVERNLLLADHLRREAGDRAIPVDEATDVDVIYDRVTDRFTGVLHDLPTATAEQRRQVRRDANRWLRQMILLELEHAPSATADRASFGCECARPRCHNRRTLNVTDYGKLVESDRFFDTHEHGEPAAEGSVAH